MVQVIRERKPWQISCDPRGDARRAPQHMRFPDRAIVWALSLGGDAEVFASRGRHRMRLSHDDWIEILRVTNKGELKHQLVRLGFRVAVE